LPRVLSFFLCPVHFVIVKVSLISFSFLMPKFLLLNTKLVSKICPSCLYDNPSHLGTYEVCEPSIQHNIHSLHQKYKWNKRRFSCFPHHSHSFQNYVRFLPFHKPQKRRSGDISRLFLSALTWMQLEMISILSRFFFVQHRLTNILLLCLKFYTIGEASRTAHQTKKSTLFGVYDRALTSVIVYVSFYIGIKAKFLA